jgi:hypothetical protein
MVPFKEYIFLSHLIQLIKHWGPLTRNHPDNCAEKRVETTVSTFSRLYMWERRVYLAPEIIDYYICKLILLLYFQPADFSLFRL